MNNSSYWSLFSQPRPLRLCVLTRVGTLSFLPCLHPFPFSFLMNLSCVQVYSPPSYSPWDSVEADPIRPQGHIMIDLSLQTNQINLRGSQFKNGYILVSWPTSQEKWFVRALWENPLPALGSSWEPFFFPMNVNSMHYGPDIYWKHILRPQE